MRRPLFPAAAALVAAVVSLNASVPVARAATYPTPSPYPISWQLEFSHAVPKRIAVDTGTGTPEPFWYMTYTVTNNTREERMFLPFFEMVTGTGQTLRSDKNIPVSVFDAVKRREGNRLLENFLAIGGEIRIGVDQARDGVAIWREPDARMGRFSIFAGGLSGEAVTAKGPDGKDLFLRKTLQLNYFIRGDEVYPGEDEVNVDAERWVMR
jgi:hypothetical protein